MDTKSVINKYIQSKSNAWSASSLKSEAARLHQLADVIALGPQAVYDYLFTKQSPYTIKTTFIRLTAFYDFAEPGHPNPFRQFMQENARLFKGVYARREVEVDYLEARKRIGQIVDLEARQLADFILHTGCRSTEALTYKGTGEVLGKGGKVRKLITLNQAPYPVNHSLTYSKFHKALHTVGLKPHTLRKLYATKLVEGGLREADLMSIMGWTNMQTASYYLIPKQGATLKQQIERMFSDGNQ